MKFSEKINQMAKTPQFQNKTTEEIGDILYSREEARNANMRRTLKSLTESSKRPVISVECSTSGALSLKRTTDVKGMKMSGRKDLVQSQVLADLSNLVRPLLAASEAMYKSGDTIRNSTLHEIDSDGKRTNEIMRDKDGNELLNADPLSQLKEVLYVLENNEQCKSALQTIRETLKEYNVEMLKAKATTRERANSPKPSLLIERPTSRSRATESTLNM
jgi:hypothetical protein